MAYKQNKSMIAGTKRHKTAVYQKTEENKPQPTDKAKVGANIGSLKIQMQKLETQAENANKAGDKNKVDELMKKISIIEDKIMNMKRKSPLEQKKRPIGPDSRLEPENVEEINKVDPITGGNNAEYEREAGKLMQMLKDGKITKKEYEKRKAALIARLKK